MSDPLTRLTLLLILVAAVAAAGASLGWAALQGFRLLRAVNRTQAHLVPLVDALNERGMLATDHTDLLIGHGEQFDTALNDLLASLRRMSVLLTAVREALDGWNKLKRYFGR